MKTVGSQFGWMMTACAGFLTLAVGCGKLDTGAHAEPSVRVKLSESATVSPVPKDPKVPGGIDAPDRKSVV